MLGRTTPQTHAPSELPNIGNQPDPSALLRVMGNDAKLEGKFDIADSIQIECEVGGELKVGGKLVIGERGSVHGDLQTVDAIIHGQYGGNMVATGSVEVTATGSGGREHRDQFAGDLQGRVLQRQRGQVQGVGGRGRQTAGLPGQRGATHRGELAAGGPAPAGAYPSHAVELHK